MSDHAEKFVPYSGKIDAVFEGGGVKGIGLVGAVAATEKQGCTFVNVAGTSAGSLVAALVAAGYTADELKQVMDELDYTKFTDRGFLDWVPGAGSLLSIALEKGIYEGRYFEEWLRDLLQRKGIREFGDLVMAEYAHNKDYRYQLRIIASDLTHCRLLKLPQDISHYGFNPDELDVAYAVRMSMSIPFFFEPVILKNARGQDCYIVDGGALSNFPVWLFDVPAGQEPEWPTVGYRLVEGDEDHTPDGKWPRRWDIRGPVSMLKALFSTMMEAHDARYIEDREFSRTIPIPTAGVRATEFDLTPVKAAALYQSGLEAGTAFWQSFDFGQWKEKYRGSAPPPSRTDRVRP